MSGRGPYVVGPAYDWALFLLPPLAALWLGVMISGTGFAQDVLVIAGLETTAAGLAVGALIHAHLVAVVFRSHGNPDVFRRHPYRFVVVPILLWVAIVASPWLAVTATVVATFWDVWHSGAQTFGFARIYDRNAGVPAEVGRRLDFWLNQLLYAGPILAGVTLADHLESFDGYADLGDTFFTAVPAQVLGGQRYLTWAILAGGTVFVAIYLVAQLRLRRAGHRISGHKVFLVSSTGLCSIYTWAFNSWGEAFFIMNAFHAVQYLGLVWAVEHRRIAGLFRVDGRRLGRPLALVGFLGAILAYGVVAELLDSDLTELWAITIVVSLMHFWYDGFVWSVRKQQI
jgi:hypothetical protein